MCQHAHSLKALLERLAVGTDVYAVSQSAHDEHARTQLSQVGDKAAYDVLSVDRAAARAHDVDDALLVEVGIALVVEHQRRVGAVVESLRIVAAAIAEHPYAMLHGPRILYLGTMGGVAAVAESLYQPGRGVGHQLAYVGAMLHDGRGRPCSAQEVEHARHVVETYAGEGDGVDDVLLVAHGCVLSLR